MSTAIFGRDAELQTVRDFVHALPSGPQVLVLYGEAGAGKTTLWRAGLERAAERGLNVLAATPTEAEATMSFAALDDLLGPVVETVLPELPPPQRRGLEVALLLTDEDQGEAVDFRAVCVASLNTLRHLAESTPVLVAVDDVEWLDAASAGVLAYALRRVHNTRVAALLSRRIGQTTSPELEHALAADDVASLTVGPLTMGALHRLIQERVGDVLSRPVLRRVHETSGGNPFYALELARALHQGRELSVAGPLPLPPTLDDLLRHRIDALPARAQDALVVAACASERRVALVSAALEVDAAAALAPAVDAQVISIDGDRIRFAHPLLAAAVLSGVEEQGRREVHRRLADAVDDPEAHARHLALAAEGTDQTVAAALEDAAEHAHARGASAAAAELSGHALRLTPTGFPHEVARRTIQAAGYRFDAGDTSGARTLLEGALASETLGELSPEALVMLQRVLRFEGDQPRAVEIARAALADPRADERTRAAAAQGLSFTLFYMREDLEAALEHARLAVGYDGPKLPLTFHLESLNAAGQLEAILGLPQAYATLRSAEELGVDDLVDVLNSARYSRLFVAHWHDDLMGAVGAANALHARALARGQEGAIPMLLALQAVQLYLTGRWQEAMGVVEDAYDLALQTGQLPQQAYTLSLRALLRASAGNEQGARTDADGALTIAGERGMTAARIHAVWALGLLELSLDRPEAAVNIVAPLRTRLIAHGVREPGSIRFVPDEIEALIALGRLEEADALLGWLEEHGGAVDRASALGSAARCRGLLAAARVDPLAAREAFERALAQHDRVPIPFDRARTLLALGTAQRRAKKRAEARRTLEDSRSVFRELGASVWATRASAELARIGGRVSSRHELTAAEQRVAALVAEGKTNKEVAAALFVTIHTVEGALTRIYRKLGVRGRAELTRRMASEDPRKE